MTNDRFDDALRRKLEEVKPPYQEKSWFQLQRFMAGRGFPPSVWHSPLQWLQPALTAAAVAGLLVTTVWQYRTNQAMNDRLVTLTQTVTRLEQVQTSLQKAIVHMNNAPRADVSRAASPSRVDTVWVVQRVPVLGEPSQLRANQPQQTIKQADGAALRYPEQPGTLAGNSSRSKPVLSSSLSPEQALETPVYTKPTVADRETGLVAAPSPVATEATARPTRSRPTAPDALVGSEVGRRDAGPTTIPQVGVAQPTRWAERQPMTTLANQAPPIATPASQAQPVTSGMLQLNTLAGISAVSEAGGWHDGWERNLRRVRYRSPFASAVASPEKNTNPVNLRWRLGIGGDIATVQTGMGVYGEVVINNRLTISTGIGQAAWVGDSYKTEVDFNKQHKVDFRRIYRIGLPGVVIGPGPTVRPRQAIDISRTGEALIVPIQLGYRLGLGKQLFLTPFMGMNLGLNPTETVSFEDERYLPRDYERLSVSVERPVGLYSSWALGFGLERQFGPFVAQLSPSATVPLNQQAGSLNTASVGLRARLFYQF